MRVHYSLKGRDGTGYYESTLFLGGTRRDGKRYGSSTAVIDREIRQNIVGNTKCEYVEK